MPFLFVPNGALQCGLLALDGVVEEGADFLLGRWLFAFEGQHGVGIRLDDFPGDPSLAAHGVEPHDATRQLQTAQQLGHCGDRVAFV